MRVVIYVHGVERKILVPGRELKDFVVVGSMQLYRNVQWFRGKLVFEVHRPLYQSTLGARV